LHANGSLTIVNLDLEHSGVYQCFLRNVAGEMSKPTWLQVNSSPPVLLTGPSNVTIVEGKEAKFDCVTRGAPKPEVKWFKGNFRHTVYNSVLICLNGIDII